MRITRNKLRQIIRESLNEITLDIVNQDEGRCNPTGSGYGTGIYHTYNSRKEAQADLDRSLGKWADEISGPVLPEPNTDACMKLNFVACLEKLIEADVWPAQCEAGPWS
jgi:hypothetical protein